MIIGVIKVSDLKGAPPDGAAEPTRACSRRRELVFGGRDGGASFMSFLVDFEPVVFVNTVKSRVFSLFGLSPKLGEEEGEPDFVVTFLDLNIIQCFPNRCFSGITA